MHGASPALRDTAAKFGASEPHLFTHDPKDRHFWLRINADGFSVEGEIGQGVSLLLFAKLFFAIYRL